MKRTGLVAVKIGVSLALLAYLLSTTDLAALNERVRAADLVDMLAAVLCFVLMLALATWRWRLLLGALGAPAPLRRLTASYLVATFFNNFLPSNIGGDVVRIADTAPIAGSKTVGTTVILVDRALGLLAGLSAPTGRAGPAVSAALDSALAGSSQVWSALQRPTSSQPCLAAVREAHATLPGSASSSSSRGMPWLRRLSCVADDRSHNDGEHHRG